MIHFEYPYDIDEEMIPLLDAMNNLPGISTQFCCSGHGGIKKDEEFYIFFHCTCIQSLLKIKESFSHSISKNNHSNWYILEITSLDKTPYNTLGVRISNETFNFLNDKERKTEILKLTNNIIKEY